MHTLQSNWTVLLIGGPSGVGKSMVARQIGLRFEIPWLEMDDLRLAFQHSHVTLPQRTEDLYFFTDTPNVWRLEPERLREHGSAWAWHYRASCVRIAYRGTRKVVIWTVAY